MLRGGKIKGRKDKYVNFKSFKTKRRDSVLVERQKYDYVCVLLPRGFLVNEIGETGKNKDRITGIKLLQNGLF